MVARLVFPPDPEKHVEPQVLATKDRKTTFPNFDPVRPLALVGSLIILAVSVAEYGH